MEASASQKRHLGRYVPYWIVQAHTLRQLADKSPRIERSNSRKKATSHYKLLHQKSHYQTSVQAKSSNLQNSATAVSYILVLSEELHPSKPENTLTLTKSENFTGLSLSPPHT